MMKRWMKRLILALCLVMLACSCALAEETTLSVFFQGLTADGNGAWTTTPLQGVFDVYRGVQIGEGNKSIAFSLTFRAADRTLTNEEVQTALDTVQKVCAEKYGAVIRG